MDPLEALQVEHALRQSAAEADAFLGPEARDIAWGLVDSANTSGIDLTDAKVAMTVATLNSKYVIGSTFFYIFSSKTN